MNVSTPPNSDDENPFVFDAPKQPLPRRNNLNQKDWEGSVVEDMKEGAADAVLDRVGGCLLRPVIWLVTLPVRLVLRIIEGIFN